MTSGERVRAALRRHEPDRVPIDFGSTTVSGVHVSCVAALRRYYELPEQPVRTFDTGAMLGEIDDDLKRILGIDTEGVIKRMTRFGFPAENWKTFRLDDGTEVLVPGGFNVTIDANGDTLMHPFGDVSLPPSARMPKNGFFFDSIIRQEPFDEDHLDPADNLEEYGLISEEELDHLDTAATRAAATGRAVIGNFGGTSFGDISLVPGVSLPHPRGIRDVAEWYVSVKARPEFVRAVFEGQCEIALKNLERIYARVGDRIDVINVCGTDFGTQKSSFCSVNTFRDLWMPYYKQINSWVHHHTHWKTFKHSCGSVYDLIPDFIEDGFDILNPVQTSAAKMDPRTLKREFGADLVFWGGGVDTQTTLPFGTPDDVYREVRERIDIFNDGGGYVFGAIHNIQPNVPLPNLLAMFAAIRDSWADAAIQGR